MAGQRSLKPLIGVRIPYPEPSQYRAEAACLVHTQEVMGASPITATIAEE